MSETKSTDGLLREAVAAVREGLIDRGMNPDSAKEIAEGARGRILVSESGASRTMARDGLLHPADGRHPFSYLISELFYGAGADTKTGVSLKDRDPEAFKEMTARARARGGY